MTYTSTASKIKAIIFDWGNVIVFYDNERLVSRMSRHFKVSKALFRDVELKNRLKHDLGMISTKRFVLNMNKGLDRRFSVKEYYSLKKKFRTSKLNIPIINIIKNVRKMHCVYVLSNNSSPVRWEIKKYGLGKLFDKVFFSYQAKMKKPNPRFFRLLLHKTGLSSKECILIDDREDSCRAARKIGMKAIVFKGNRQLKKELAALIQRPLSHTPAGRQA